MRLTQVLANVALLISLYSCKTIEREYLSSLNDATVTQFTCSCTASWNCSVDQTISGSVTSNQTHVSISQNTAQTACAVDLSSQLNSACSQGQGNSVLQTIYSCTSTTVPLPSPSPAPLPPSPSPAERTWACKGTCAYNVYVWDSGLVGPEPKGWYFQENGRETVGPSLGLGESNARIDLQRICAVTCFVGTYFKWENCSLANVSCD